MDYKKYAFGKTKEQRLKEQQEQQEQKCKKELEDIDKEKVFVYVDFKFKEIAKSLGAKFDWDEKKWYIYGNKQDFIKQMTYKIATRNS